MKAEEIIESIFVTTQSPDHDEDAVLGILNRGLVEIAGGGDRPHGEARVAPLPDLLTVAEIAVEAGDRFIVLPSDYHRALVRVEIDGEPLRRVDSHMDFLGRYGKGTGDPVAYSLKGKRLWLGPVPNGDIDLTVHYHRLPATMKASDEPEGLPDHLQYKLLFHYGCREIFSDIEQGLDGANPDTIKHSRQYALALTDLERFIGPEDGEATNIADELYTDDMIQRY